MLSISCAEGWLPVLTYDRKSKIWRLKLLGSTLHTVKVSPKSAQGCPRYFFLSKKSFIFEWSCFFLDIFHIERERPGKSHKAILIEKKILFRMSMVSAINPHQPMVKFILFSKKVNFRRKFMVFRKIFFAQKNQRKKLPMTVPSKSVQNMYSRSWKISRNST